MIDGGKSCIDYEQKQLGRERNIKPFSPEKLVWPSFSSGFLVY